MQTAISKLPVIHSPESPRNDSNGGGRDLPEDILYTVLVNLPPKQVFRLKSVSKQWNSIISSPYFFKAYTATNTRAALQWTLLMNYSSDQHQRIFNINSIKTFLSSWFHASHPLFSWYDSTLPSCVYTHRVVVSSSHGFLLCRLTGPRYAVWSPLTRQWFVLPSFKLFGYNELDYKEALVIKIEAGTGAVPNLVTFKVIRMQSDYQSDVNGTVLNLEIYDSVTNEWTESQLHLPHALIYKQLTPVCLNGIVHWEFYSRVLVAYDPTDNQCRSLKCPNYGKSSLYPLMLGICNSKLQYLDMDRGGADCLQVWVLEDYDQWLWVLKYNVPCNEIVTTSYCERYSPVAFHPLDSNIIYMIDRHEKRLRSYDFEERKFMDSRKIVAAGCICRRDVFPFVLPLWPFVIGVAEKAKGD